MEIRQTPNGDIFVRNAKQLIVNSADELLEALRYGYITVRGVDIRQPVKNRRHHAAQRVDAHEYGVVTLACHLYHSHQADTHHGGTLRL